MATPGEIGRPGDLPVPAGEQLRRWGALLALAGLALPGVTAARVAAERPAEVAVMEVGRMETRPGSEVPRVGAAEEPAVPSGDAGRATAPATGVPWEAGLVEADGMPLPTAPPSGPVPVDGIPRPATAAPVTGLAAATAPPGPGEIARSVPDPSAAGSARLVPAEREYLRPILVGYAQENGLPADVVMALAWVESSWRRGAVSEAGAVGVMQLMPDTVEYVSKTLLGLRSNLDPRNATSSVRMGTRYLRHLLGQNRGSLRQALIAYHQGPTSLRTRGSYGVSERYADRVLALRSEFRPA